MASQDAPRRYTQEEVQAILRRAIDRQGPSGSITHEELTETARELGIDPSQLEVAINEQQTVGEFESAQERWKKQRKQKFFEHLRAYLIVNAVLLLINIFGGGPVWFIFVLFGWGIGIAFDYADAFWPKQKDVDRGARRLIERENRLAGKRGTTVSGGKKGIVIDSKGGKIIIEKGDKYIQIG